jgi:3D (Asp-Asp-Asp) domain-containing protein
MFAALAVAGLFHLSLQGNFVSGATSAYREYYRAGDILPYPAGPVEFEATAYCEAGLTKSGVPAAPGLAAADESVLPLGTLVHVEGIGHRGIYRIMDTGRLIKGRIIDIYMTDLEDAVEFGRRKVRVSVLQHGRPPARRALMAD